MVGSSYDIRLERKMILTISGIGVGCLFWKGQSPYVSNTFIQMIRRRDGNNDT